MGLEKFSGSGIKDFIVLQYLFQNNCGAVIKVQYKYDNKLYVLKQRILSEVGGRKNAMSEVNLLMQSDHPNIIKCFGHFFEESNNSIYIVLEYCECGDLGHMIASRRKRQEYFDESFIWSIFHQICLGVKHLHELGIVHRDIKSLNVLLSKNGITPKLGDLGVSKQLINTDMMSTFQGTPLYISPELLNGDLYTEKTDIWSLGNRNINNNLSPK